MNYLNIKINQILELLYKIYDIFNKELFNAELPRCVINLGYNRGKKELSTLGRTYINLEWIDVDTGEIEYAIEITPLAINGGIYEIITTLLHEMVHVYNKMLNIKDCSKSGKHNKDFKLVAEKVGLLVDEDEKYGWAITSLSERHYKLIDSVDYNKEIFHIECIITKDDNEKENPKKKKLKYKHYCPNGHNEPFILSKQQLNLKCSICNSDLIIDEINNGK